MKKLIALVAIAAAPVLFAQEKVSVNKVSEVKQTEASKVEKKATVNAEQSKVKATHAKGAASLESTKATESRRSSATIKEEKAK